MTVNRVVRIIAGFFVLLSLALGVEASPLFQNVNWLWFTAFVGANLFQSGFTNWCLMDKILTRLGVPAGASCKSA
ncbi:MAG: YgaP family membrane protein [Pseudomonadota bacterium]